MTIKSATNANVDPIARELRHDARNQLFALRTAMAVLEQTLGRDQALSARLRLCSRSVEKLAATIQEYFALDTGEQTGDAVQLDELLAENAASLRPAAVAMGFDLELRAPPLQVHTRSVPLQIALRHLLRIALQHAASPLELTAERRASTVSVAAAWREKSGPPAPPEVTDGELALVEGCLSLCKASLELLPGGFIIRLPDLEPLDAHALVAR